MAYSRRHPTIYEITNAITGKRYVGMTSAPLIARWNAHLRDAANGAKTSLHAAMRKYGVENFSVQPIFSLFFDQPRSVLLDYERYFIMERNTYAPVGYNLTRGGDGRPEGVLGSRVGIKASLEHKASLSRAWTPERKARFVKRMAQPDAVAAREAKWTLERREEMRRRRIDRNKEQNVSVEHRAKLCDAWAKNPERHVKTAETLRDSLGDYWTLERRAAQAQLRAEQNKAQGKSPAFRASVRAAWARRKERESSPTTQRSIAK